MWDEELLETKKIAVNAGKAIIAIYNSKDFGLEYKSDASPLTKADRAANQIITEGLKEKFPNYAILSEEEQDNKERLKNDFCFVVDPLDGTKEFLKRNGQFTVNIALSFRHESVMGVIYVPVIRLLYWASKGNGAYRGKVTETGLIERIIKLKVSDNLDMRTNRVVMSSSHGCQEMDDLIKKHHLNNYVRMGSSLKGCLIAEGNAEIYYRHNPTMEWDTAAMQCIVEEAGGIFRQMDGSRMYYNRENSLNSKGFYIVNNKKNILDTNFEQ